MHGERVCIGGLPFAHHSTMALRFCGDLGLLHEHSPLWSSSLPSPQTVFSQPTAVLSTGLLSKPNIPAPCPCMHQWTHLSGLGMQGCGMDHLCRSHSVQPATDQLLHSLSSPQSSPLSQLISPPVRGLPWTWEILLSFSSPQGAQVPSHFSSSFSLLLSFILLCYVGIFLVLLVV